MKRNLQPLSFESFLSALGYLSPSKINSVCLFGTKAAGLNSVVWGSAPKLPSRLPSLVRGDLAAGGWVAGCMGRELKVRSHEHTGIRARGSENTLKSNDNDNKKHGKKMLGAGLATHTCPETVTS